MRLKDLTGQRFGSLTVLRRANNRGGRVNFECLCDCGGKTIAYSHQLISGKTVCCGCIPSRITHGMSSTREYKIWFDMHRRCGAPSNKNFPRYGARGIRVCARWDSFESFIADMGNAHGLTLDRIDNEGDYEPNNCRWASRKQQSRNRTTARLISFNGETRCVSEWAEAIGIKPDTLKRRFLLGWSPERALIAFGETR